MEKDFGSTYLDLESLENERGEMSEIGREEKDDLIDLRFPQIADYSRFPPLADILIISTLHITITMMAAPKLRHPLNSLLTPGERIGSVNARGTAEKKVLVAGKGTYVRQVR